MLEDRHIRLSQIGKFNKKDENGVFSAGEILINPNNILYLEEARCEEEFSQEELLREYEKDPSLTRFCVWCFSQSSKIEVLVDWWTKCAKAKEQKTSSTWVPWREKAIVRHTRVNLITGKTILVNECPEEVRKRINDFFEREAKDIQNKITISKDDIVKNFIFKNLG